MMSYLIARMGEPSTYATIASLLVGLHVSMDPGLWQNIVRVGIAVSGLAGVLLAERTKVA